VTAALPVLELDAFTHNYLGLDLEAFRLFSRTSHAHFCTPHVEEKLLFCLFWTFFCPSVRPKKDIAEQQIVKERGTNDQDHSYQTGLHIYEFSLINI